MNATNSKFYKVFYDRIERYEDTVLGTQWRYVDAEGNRKSTKVEQSRIDAILNGQAEEIQIVKPEPVAVEAVAKKAEEPATQKQIWLMDRNQIPYPKNVSKTYASFLIEQGLRG